MATSDIDPFSNLEDIVFYVYEAKRFGELSPHVGRTTEMVVVWPSPIGGFFGTRSYRVSGLGI
jgi:hypothetical protein